MDHHDEGARRHMAGTRGQTPARQGGRRLRALVLGLLIIMAGMTGVTGCGSDLNGRDPVQAFQPLSPEEEHALQIMRAYITAAEALLKRDDIPAAQRSELEAACASARRALQEFIRTRRQGSAREQSLTIISGAAIGIISNDPTVIGLGDNALLIPLGIAAMVTTIFTSSPATRDALLESWHQVGQELDELGDTVEDVFKTVDIAPVPADPEERKKRCTPVPTCPHRGNDPIHDACADAVPPNKHPGCDVFVNGHHFDALGPSGRVLWEIKTDDWSSYPGWLQQRTLDKHADTARMEYKLAKACHFEFVFAVADRGLYEQLSDALDFIPVRHVPQCSQGKKP